MISAYGRKFHVLAVWLFVAGVLVQGYLAGSALTQLGGSGDFSTHTEFGYTVMGLLGLAVLATALIGRVSRGQIGLSAVMLVLYVIQTILPGARASSPAIAALHPLNAMVLLVAGCVAGWRAWRLVSPARVA